MVTAPPPPVDFDNPAAVVSALTDVEPSWEVMPKLGHCMLSFNVAEGELYDEHHVSVACATLAQEGGRGDQNLSLPTHESPKTGEEQKNQNHLP